MLKSTIDHYNSFITSIETMAEGRRYFYHVGDRFIIEVSKCEHDQTNKNDLMNLWKKAGHITEALPTHIDVKTYYTDCEGNCWGLYNVTHTRRGGYDGRKELQNEAQNI